MDMRNIDEMKAEINYRVEKQAGNQVDGQADNKTGNREAYGINPPVKPIEESWLLQNPEQMAPYTRRTVAGNAGNMNGTGNPGGIWQEPAAAEAEESLLVKNMRGNYGYFGGLCLLYGILFTFCLYKNPNGLTWPVLVLGTMGISYGMLKKIGFTVKKDTIVYCIGMVLLGIQTAMTCSGFLVFFNIVGILMLFLTAMMHQFYADEKWSFPVYVKNLTIICFVSIGRVFWPFTHGLAYFTEARKENDEGKRKTVAAVGLGILIAVGLLIVVFPMLLRSDMVFEGIFKDAFYEVEFGSFLGITFMLFVGFISSYAFFSALCSSQFEEKEEKRKNFNSLIAITFTGILAMVYALYAGIQVLYLFLKLGSLPDGVTYSAYAREGFFELLFVGLINFILVLVCMALFRGSKVLYGILTVICGCTFIMIASAVYRMMLYVQTYHLTFLRILVLWFLIVLALVMAGVTISIYRKSFPLFRYIAAVVGCGYILFSFARPDRVIAEYNLQHMETVSMWDIEYMLYGLSDDAAPVIAELDVEKLVDYGKADRDTASYDGDVYSAGVGITGEQELTNYFHYIADQYKCLSVRELNLSKLQARAAAEKWLAENGLY